MSSDHDTTIRQTMTARAPAARGETHEQRGVISDTAQIFGIGAVGGAGGHAAGRVVDAGIDAAKTQIGKLTGCDKPTSSSTDTPRGDE